MKSIQYSNESLNKVPHFPSTMFNDLLLNHLFPLIHSNVILSKFFPSNQENLTLLHKASPFFFQKALTAIYSEMIINVSVLMDSGKDVHSIPNLVLHIGQELRKKEDHEYFSTLQHKLLILKVSAEHIIDKRNYDIAHRMAESVLKNPTKKQRREVSRYVSFPSMNDTIDRLMDIFLFISYYFKGEAMKYWQIQEEAEKGVTRLLECLAKC